MDTPLPRRCKPEPTAPTRASRPDGDGTYSAPRDLRYAFFIAKPPNTDPQNRKRSRSDFDSWDGAGR